jgi:hypothetical protein
MTCPHAIEWPAARHSRTFGDTRFERVPTSMRYLAQAVVSHPPAVAAPTMLQLSDRTSVMDQFSLVDGTF